MEKKSITVNQEQKGIRLDVFVTSQESTLTRSAVKHMLDDGLICVNGQSVKAGFCLKMGDIVTYSIPSPKEIDLTPEDISIEILYQDGDLAVINKPQGLAVHPSAGHFNHTLVHALLFHLGDLSGINGELRPGIVHRLDKDTSGVMIVAKNDKAHRDLAEQIAAKTCIRRYYCLVEGRMKESSGHIETYIARDKHDRKKMAVSTNSLDRKAISEWKLVKNFEKYALLEFQLQTGRTHQIRVHCSYLHHPIVGDVVYGKKHQDFALNGQLLHSHYIEFTHPTSKLRLNFECALPDYFNAVLKKIK